jgi:hypothetical protein
MPCWTWSGDRALFGRYLMTFARTHILSVCQITTYWSVSLTTLPKRNLIPESTIPAGSISSGLPRCPKMSSTLFDIWQQWVLSFSASHKYRTHAPIPLRVSQKSLRLSLSWTNCFQKKEIGILRISISPRGTFRFAIVRQMPCWTSSGDRALFDRYPTIPARTNISSFSQVMMQMPASPTWFRRRNPKRLLPDLPINTEWTRCLRESS